MSEFERIAPRLARAHREEVRYQERKRLYRQRGQVAFDVAAEEIVRSVRVVFRSLDRTMRSLVARGQADA